MYINLINDDKSKIQFARQPGGRWSMTFWHPEGFNNTPIGERNMTPLDLRGTWKDPDAWKSKNQVWNYTGFGYNHPPDAFVPWDYVVRHCRANPETTVFFEHTDNEKIGIAKSFDIDVWYADKDEVAVWNDLRALEFNLEKGQDLYTPGWYYLYNTTNDGPWGPYEVEEELYLDVYDRDYEPDDDSLLCKKAHDVDWSEYDSRKSRSTHRV